MFNPEEPLRLSDTRIEIGGTQNRPKATVKDSIDTGESQLQIYCCQFNSC